MKTYVFIVRRICTISGAVQYVYNKTKYLESHGWRVLVFSSMYGPILVKELEKFSQYIYPSLYYSPSYYRKMIFDNTINSIIKDIGCIKDEECIIESDALPRAVWAEVVASRLKCRHLVFLIRERHEYNKEMKDFLLFKYIRHELAGITDNTMSQVFEDSTIQKRDDTRFSACCKNVIEDCEDNYSELLDDSADYTFGSLGRLDKSCVPNIVDAFCSYANCHLSNRFNIVLIGGSISKGKGEAFRKKLQACPNVRAVLTGDIYPIPISFVKRFDAFISTAGAAGVTYNVGIPTIKVHPINAHPVGIIGMDFFPGEKTMYDTISNMSLEECIDKAIRSCHQIQYVSSSNTEYIKSMHAEFERQLSFVNQVTSSDYYDIKLLLRIKEKTLYGILRRCLLHLFGIKKYDLICRYLRGRMV